MITIKEVNKKDLEILASLYSIIYLNIKPHENWTYETALSYMQYFYHYQPDLFICAYDDGIPIAAVMSTLKPYFDGMRLSNTEIFVSEDYNALNIGKKLLETHFELANSKYNARHIDTITYKNILDTPLDLCKKVGLKPNHDLVVLNGNLENCLKLIREEP